MNRRNFLKKCSLTFAGTAIAGNALAGIEIANNSLNMRVNAKQHNVLFVLVDQWRFCAMSHGKNHDRLVKTPNLDKLAKQGVDWSRCYATHPVCTPNRSALITGRWPWETGMNRNDLMLPPGEKCIAESFTDAGYKSHYIGKWHMDGTGKADGAGFVPPGWRRRGFTTFEGFNRGHNYWYYNSYMMTNEGVQMKNLTLYSSDTYEPTFQTSLAIDFMTENKNRPFFCFVSWGPPHTPYDTHPDEYSYKSADVVVRPNVPAANISAAQGSLNDYFAHCTAMDHEIGRLMKALDSLKLADNTLVVFTADHGDMHRSHNLTYKSKPEEESWHVPLIMRLPGKAEGGKITENLISSADLMPTVLSICGVEIPETCTGKDKSAAMTNDQFPDESIYGGIRDNWRGVVKGNHKLVIETQQDPVTLEVTQIATKLFDLKTDPYEMTNLVNQPDQLAIQNDLLAEIEIWKTKTTDTFPQAPTDAKAYYDA